MASKKATKSKKQVKQQASRLADIKKSVSTTTSSVIDEIDKASDVVVHEIREGFNVISAKARSAAKTAADASVNVKDIVAESHPKQILSSLVDEVEEVAESIVKVVRDRFSQLTTTAEKEVKKKAAKKAVKKKAAKKAVKKKTAKKAVKKKTAKKAVKKKTAKKAVKKKTAKKAVKKKTAK